MVYQDLPSILMDLSTSVYPNIDDVNKKIGFNDKILEYSRNISLTFL